MTAGHTSEVATQSGQRRVEGPFGQDLPSQPQGELSTTFTATKATADPATRGHCDPTFHGHGAQPWGRDFSWDLDFSYLPPSLTPFFLPFLPSLPFP